MTKLDELYGAALEYDSTPHDAALLTMQFIRRLKYSGGSWTTVAGAVNSQFVDYVEANYPNESPEVIIKAMLYVREHGYPKKIGIIRWFDFILHIMKDIVRFHATK